MRIHIAPPPTMQQFILPLLVALLALSLNSFRTTVDIVAYSSTYQSGTTHDNAMTDAWIPIRNTGRGRAPFNRGGRGTPRGGHNAVSPCLHMRPSGKARRLPVGYRPYSTTTPPPTTLSHSFRRQSKDIQHITTSPLTHNTE